VRRRLLLTFVIALLALAGCEFGTVEDEATPPETVTAAPVPGTPDPVIDPDQEQTDVERPEGVDMHEDAKDETPPGISPSEAEEARETPAGVGPPQPLGGAELLSCPFQPVRNFSSRGGARVSMIVVHYTVSAPGTLDVIQNLFNTSSFAASSHIGLEFNGRCEQWVRYSDKAWTEGAFNPVGVSVEIIARGTESKEFWLAQPIIKNGLLASWIVDRLRQFGLPPKLVDPVGCTATAGWTDHNFLECGNTHTDVQPNFPYRKVQEQVVALFNAGQTRVVWRVMSGGQILAERARYSRLVVWLGNHPGIVRAAEKATGAVNLRRVTVPIS
jgi:hypothetical protein